MDEQRMHAYRYLIYWAMLDIRPLAWLSAGGLQEWNPLFWRREAKRIRCAGAIADWMHNLALYSSANFERFDEDRFWRDFESARSRYPEFELQRYRDVFDKHAAL